MNDILIYKSTNITNNSFVAFVNSNHSDEFADSDRDMDNLCSFIRIIQGDLKINQKPSQTICQLRLVMPRDGIRRASKTNLAF